MNCRMCIRSLLTCMHGNITNTLLCHVIQLELLRKVVIIFKVNLTCRIDCHYVSINSSDKHKCYELIKKLSAIYHSDKEYLKVCTLKCVQFKLHRFFLFLLLQFTYVCLRAVGKTFAAASSSERGRGCGQERATAVMARDGPGALRVPQ